MIAKQRLLEQLAKLHADGQAVLASKFSNDGPNYYDANSPYVDLQSFQRWLASYRNLIFQIGPPAKPWESGIVDGDGNQYVTAVSLMGQLEALQDAIENDLLHKVEDLVMSDAFGSLLEQAEHLLSRKFVLAAGVLARALLEEHLRNLCGREKCLPGGRPTINDLNSALYKNNIINKITMQQVTAMAAAGNHCAHNNQPLLGESEVEKLLSDVRDFLARHPLG